MLMFGGYTSSSSSLATTEASGELWLYSLEKDTWTQLESAVSIEYGDVHACGREKRGEKSM